MRTLFFPFCSGVAFAFYNTIPELQQVLSVFAILLGAVIPFIIILGIVTML
jgi:hypothetical protein